MSKEKKLPKKNLTRKKKNSFSMVENSQGVLIGNNDNNKITTIAIKIIINIEKWADYCVWYGNGFGSFQVFSFSVLNE